MESRAISDGQISASSQWDGNHAASQGRLNFQAVPGKAGSWSALTNDANQWLQIDLGNQHNNVTSVATQGRNGLSQWVTRYKVQYSDDGVNFLYYQQNGADKVRLPSSMGTLRHCLFVRYQCCGSILFLASVSIFLCFKQTMTHCYIHKNKGLKIIIEPRISSEFPDFTSIPFDYLLISRVTYYAHRHGF